ncbi:MAG: serine hydrolase [Cyanobacteria bacterium P01_A01_bin.83]
MNRKGKKSQLTRVKGATAKKKSPALTKSALGSNPKSDSAVAKKSNKRNQQKSSVKSSRLLNPRQQSPKSRSPLRIIIYVITITIGLSTIFGTLVSIAGSWQTSTPEKTPEASTISSNSQKKTKLDNLFAITALGKEITTLKSSLQELAHQYPNIEPQIFLVDLDTKGFVSLNSKEIIAAASTIKLPVLVAFFQDVDRGQIQLEEQLIMTKDVIAGGSGGMQYQKPNTKFSALKTAEQMMITSDNTATNMLIQRLGGMEKVNQRFIKMGLTSTRLRNPLPDLTGTNTTTTEDLGNLLVKVNRGDLISLRSRDRMLYIMRQTVTNTLLPEGLESGAIIAHKTGDIKPVLGDVGMIDIPNGKRYIASMLVKRPDNDPKAKEFIQKASGITYQYLKNARTDKFTLEDE